MLDFPAIGASQGFAYFATGSMFAILVYYASVSLHQVYYLAISYVAHEALITGSTF
jgi:hypothetical protein